MDSREILGFVPQDHVSDYLSDFPPEVLAKHSLLMILAKATSNSLVQVLLGPMNQEAVTTPAMTIDELEEATNNLPTDEQLEIHFQDVETLESFPNWLQKHDRS